MNKVVLVGRLDKRPEVRYSQGDSATGYSKIYSSSRPQIQKQRRRTDRRFYLRVLCLDVLRLSLQRNISSGYENLLLGRIQTGSYTNKDGVESLIQQK